MTEQEYIDISNKTSIINALSCLRDILEPSEIINHKDLIKVRRLLHKMQDKHFEIIKVVENETQS